MQHVKRMLAIAAAVGATTLAAGVGTAGADGVPGCGQGFTLTYSPGLEAIIATQTHGNVNSDGYVCVNNHAAPRGDLIVIIDNTVPAG